jgi:hypothetical protein
MQTRRPRRSETRKLTDVAWFFSVLWIPVLSAACVETGGTTVNKDQEPSQPSSDNDTTPSENEEDEPFSDMPCGQLCNKITRAGCGITSLCEVNCTDLVDTHPECEPEFEAFVECTVEEEPDECDEDGALVLEECIEENDAFVVCVDPTAGTCTPSGDDDCSICLATTCCEVGLTCDADAECAGALEGYATCWGNATTNEEGAACDEQYIGTVPLFDALLDCVSVDCSDSCGG